ncbi:hypothetical protein V6N13_081372 [Hibiscus sabdariffa]
MGHGSWHHDHKKYLSPLGGMIGFLDSRQFRHETTSPASASGTGSDRFTIFVLGLPIDRISIDLWRGE